MNPNLAEKLNLYMFLKTQCIYQDHDPDVKAILGLSDIIHILNQNFKDIKILWTFKLSVKLWYSAEK